MDYSQHDRNDADACRPSRMAVTIQLVGLNDGSVQYHMGFGIHQTGVHGGIAIGLQLLAVLITGLFIILVSLYFTSEWMDEMLYVGNEGPGCVPIHTFTQRQPSHSLMLTSLLSLLPPSMHVSPHAHSVRPHIRSLAVPPASLDVCPRMHTVSALTFAHLLSLLPPYLDVCPRMHTVSALTFAHVLSLLPPYLDV